MLVVVVVYLDVVAVRAARSIQGVVGVVVSAVMEGAVTVSFVVT